jgi:hypothetical protein
MISSKGGGKEKEKRENHVEMERGMPPGNLIHCFVCKESVNLCRIKKRWREPILTNFAFYIFYLHFIIFVVSKDL